MAPESTISKPNDNGGFAPRGRPARTAEQTTKAPADGQADPCLGRCPPRADRCLAKAYLWNDPRDPWRNVAEGRCGLAARFSRPERRVVVAPLVGQASRCQESSGATPSDGPTDPCLGRCPSRADRRLAEVQLWNDPRDRWRNVAEGRCGLVARFSRPERRDDVGPLAGQASRCQKSSGATPSDGQADPCLGGRPSRADGAWPKCNSGTICGTGGETWQNVNAALHFGSRGVSGGSSLARLLAKHRGVRNRRAQPRLTVQQILKWADAHRERTGRWPTRNSGAVPGTRYERWDNLYIMLGAGCRGLPRTTLRRLRIKYRGKQGRWQRPLLTVRQILAWADAHYRRSGKWPTVALGRIVEAPDETWSGIAAALSFGRRGLSGGTSLRKLLTKHHGGPVGNRPLTVQRVLKWADEHHARTGQWPAYRGGAIPGAGGETCAASPRPCGGGRGASLAVWRCTGCS